MNQIEELQQQNQELREAYSEYIEFLEENSANYESMLRSQSWFEIDQDAVKKGKELRLKIEQVLTKEK